VHVTLCPKPSFRPLQWLPYHFLLSAGKEMQLTQQLMNMH